jgi:hypothetical protein
MPFTKNKITPINLLGSAKLKRVWLYPSPFAKNRPLTSTSSCMAFLVGDNNNKGENEIFIRKMFFHNISF